MTTVHSPTCFLHLRQPARWHAQTTFQYHWLDEPPTSLMFYDKEQDAAQMEFFEWAAPLKYLAWTAGYYDRP